MKPPLMMKECEFGIIYKYFFCPKAKIKSVIKSDNKKLNATKIFYFL